MDWDEATTTEDRVLALAGANRSLLDATQILVNIVDKLQIRIDKLEALERDRER